MLLHHCVAELQGRIKRGATPGPDILAAEVYRLCRSRGMRSFQECRAISSQTLGGWAWGDELMLCSRI